MSYTKFVITSGSSPGTGYPAYGQAGGILMAIGLHIPTPHANGSLPILMVSLHGIEAVGARGDITTPNGVDRVANKSVPLLIKNPGAELPAVLPDGGVVGKDERKIAVMFPQCSSEYGTFPFAYAIECIKYAKANLSGQVDLDRIIIFGYSFGAGCVISISKDQYIIDNVAAMVGVSPGYNQSPNYPVVAAGGMPLYLFGTVPDALAGIAIVRGFVNNLNVQRPVYPVTYIEFVGTGEPDVDDHDAIIVTITRPTVTGLSYKMTNGDQYVQSRSIYKIIAKHTKYRRKRAA